MGVLSYLKPAKAPTTKEKAPAAIDLSLTNNPTPMRSYAPSMRSMPGTPLSPEEHSFHDFKCDIMVEHLYQQQQSFRWTSDGADEGVVMKKHRDEYTCYPKELMEYQNGFMRQVEALNVKVAMTVSTPLIRRFSNRNVVSLPNGLQIQVLPSIHFLANCQKYQSAAFITDRAQLIVWDDEPTALVDRVARLEKELLALIWQAERDEDLDEKKGISTINEKEIDSSSGSLSDVESGSAPTKTYKTKLLQPFSEGIAVGLAFWSIGQGVKTLLIEIAWDQSYVRLALLVTLPLSLWVAIFFFQVVTVSCVQILGPINQLQQNTKFFSGQRPVRLSRHREGGLPHVTIQMPVYKEGLEAVIVPTIRSIKAAISTYEMQGGSANIFINDDGLQLVDGDQARARIDFYEENNIGWVARPKHNPNPGEGEGAPFLRRGKFKKASNMNYAMWVSARVEEKIALLDESQWTEDQAFQHALDEVVAEDEGRTWAAGNIRIGDYILIIDSDTRVPRDCMLDSVSEMEHNPNCGIMQHASGVMNVTDSFFENGITFFTNMVYSQIKYAVASGDVAPFVGHNAFLRWSAIQFIGFECPDDHREKWWSESSVSEDFDMALRLQNTGYLVRLAGFTSPEGELFEEGVSLTVYDELTRWEKYAYGCSELIFWPLKDWFKHGPFTPLFRQFVVSNIPLSSKFTIMAYVGTYFAIGCSWVLTIFNYFVAGWGLTETHLDHFYTPSFNLYFAIVCVFWLLGNVTLAILRFRGEGKSLIGQLFENFKWLPLMAIFIGGLSMHVSQAILSHLFSIDMSWGATAKEVDNSTFFEEVPKILNKFRFTFAFCIAMAAGMVVLGVEGIVPQEWRITDFVAIWPAVSILASHFFLPILLNPQLVLFKW